MAEEQEKEITKNVTISAKTHLIISCIALLTKMQMGEVIDLALNSHIDSLPDKMKHGIKTFISLTETQQQ